MNVGSVSFSRSPDLRDVIVTGTYVPPITRQVGQVVQKLFDAIKHNWSEVDARVHTSVTKFKRQQSSRRKRRRGGGGGGGGGGGDMEATLATAKEEARSGSKLAQSTDDLLGSRRLFRSLNVAYQRLRECLKRYDSSGGAHGGRLDAMEFRAAIESIGIFLTSDECDFLTSFALETCAPASHHQRGGAGRGNTGCVGINEFIAEVLRPDSSSSSKAEGVAQAVVRYCMDVSRRKATSRSKAYGGGGGGGGGHRSSSPQMARVREQNQEMRRELQSLKVSQEKWQHKSMEAEQFLDGRGPKPEWMSLHAPESHAAAGGTTSGTKEGGSHRAREETVFRAKIAHEKLRQKKRLMQQKIRQESARVRRMEMRAAADPTLRRAIELHDGTPTSTQPTVSTELHVQRATDRPVKQQQQQQQQQTSSVSVPLQLKSLVASLRNAIHMDRRLSSLPPEDRLNGFFDVIQQQEENQGMVRTSDSDDVAGGSMISSIRQMRPAVLLPPEQCPAFLKALGCSLGGGVGEVTEDGKYDPVAANRVKRERFIALLQKKKKKKKTNLTDGKQKRVPQRPASSGGELWLWL